MSTPRRGFVRDNSLSIGFGVLFLAALAPNFGIATACFTLCDFLSKLDVPTLAAIGLSQSGRKSGRTR